MMGVVIFAFSKAVVAQPKQLCFPYASHQLETPHHKEVVVKLEYMRETLAVALML